MLLLDKLASNIALETPSKKKLRLSRFIDIYFIEDKIWCNFLIV